MKRVLPILLLLSMFGLAEAQNTHLVNEWMINASGNQPILVSAITSSPSGNLYVAGSFEENIKLRKQTIGAKADGHDFIAKFNKQDSLELLSAIKACGYYHISSLHADSFDNLFVAGYFSDTLQIAGKQLVAKNYIDAFIADIDEDGEMQNFKQIESSFYGTPLIYKTDQQGYRYLVTSFTGKSFSMGKKTFVTDSYHNIIVLKFNQDNNIVKSILIPGNGKLIVNDMTISKSGIFLSGTFSNYFTINTKEYRSKGRDDAFFITLDGDLSTEAVKIFGTEYNDAGGATAFDKEGDVLYAGTFTGDLKITNKVLLRSNGNTDVFIIKYDSKGNLSWADNIGGSSSKHLKSLVINKSGNIYVAGSFSGKIKKKKEYAVSKKSTENVFIAKYNPLGKFEFIEALGDTAASVTCRLLADDEGNLFIGGNYYKRFQAIDKKSDSTGDLSFYVTCLFDCDAAQKVKLPADTVVCADEYTIIADSGFSSYVWNGISNNNFKFNAKRSGSYVLEVSDQYGCISSDTMVLKINKPLQVDLGDDITVQKGETIELDAGSGFEKYVWNTGCRQQKLFVNTENAITGDYLYKVTTTDENNCTSTDKVLVSVADGLIVKLYPNPATEWVTVEITNINKKEKLKIQIITQKGQTVKEQIINNCTIINKKINTSTLNAGEYYLIVINGKSEKVIKLFKL